MQSLLDLLKGYFGTKKDDFGGHLYGGVGEDSHKQAKHKHIGHFARAPHSIFLRSSQLRSFWDGPKMSISGPGDTQVRLLKLSTPKRLRLHGAGALHAPGRRAGVSGSIFVDGAVSPFLAKGAKGRLTNFRPCP